MNQKMRVHWFLVFSRFALFVAVLLVVQEASGQKGETPPYDPAPPSGGMSAYTNQDLDLTLYYPKEFVVRTPEDLQTVMNRGHRAFYGSDPKSDPEHIEAVRCMHTLLYATADRNDLDESTNPDSQSADTILVVDVDRSCIPKKPKGDKLLTTLAGSILHLPGAIQLVPQMWFVAGGKRHIHSGMAETMLTPARCSGKNNPSTNCSSVPVFVVAAAMDQRTHDILVVYLSGTSQAKHDLVPHMSVAFDSGRPVLLFPFLMGNINLIK